MSTSAWKLVSIIDEIMQDYQDLPNVLPKSFFYIYITTRKAYNGPQGAKFLKAILTIHWLKTHLQNENKVRGTVNQVYIQISLSESHWLNKYLHDL